MEGLKEDFILSNDTLKSQGIDVNNQLSQLAAGPPAADEDPFDLVREKLNEMVVAAGDNGFDSGYLDSLREIVFEYEDVFRIDLLADPPAKVEPLRIAVMPNLLEHVRGVILQHRVHSLVDTFAY
ncbi:hypothetical protein PHPALM_27806 [Phytophthora palmivora]|uniref:Uncharacterized protein n=1 Tax=Phytophthora palmivora TaxID=4796 RepID=A0A2P4XBQ7_9STRA|nr:hypothetical protein PHPALM_27806 [Phytophthora palmivora]